MAKAGTKRRIHQMTIPQWESALPDEDACCAYLVKHRWPTGIFCLRCGAEADHPVKTMPFKWQCYACNKSGYRFSHITGTVFENSNKPLRQWFRVVHLMLTSKKGISALQIHRTMGFGSYETTWSMCHRIRAAQADEQFGKLVGIVEVDKTFVGGKAKNRHWDKRGGGGGTGGIGSGKSAVVGAVSRKGNVVARVIQNVRGRGMVGTFHKVSKKYLPLYVAEFQFRYNNRENDNIFAEAIKGC
jgi:hypothetical protein